MPAPSRPPIEALWPPRGRGPSITVSAALLAGLVPAVLVLSHLALEPERWALELGGGAGGFGSLSLVTAFTASYVHASPAHLVDNVLFYWVVLAALVPLAAIAGWQRKLLAAVGSFLVALPIVTAWASLQTGHAGFAMGFSGVNAALLGLLPVVLFAALGRRGAPHATPAWSVVPTLLAVAAVVWTTDAAVAAAIGQPVPVVDALVLVAAALGIAPVGLRWGPILRLALRMLTPEHAAITLGCGVFCVGLDGLFFLAAPAAGVNVFAHLVGFVVGFAAPYLAFVAGPRVVRASAGRARNRSEQAA